MKKISIISFIFVLGLFSWNCSQQTEVSEPEYEFTEVAIPDNLKSDLKSYTEVDIVETEIKITTREGNVIYGKMRFTIPVGDEEKLVNFEMTKNVFQKTDLTPNFLLKQDLSFLKSTTGIGACLKNCKDAGNPKGCKGGCWAELAIKAATAAATVILAIVAIS